MARDTSASSTSTLRQEASGVENQERDLEKDASIQSESDESSPAGTQKTIPNPAKPEGRYSDSPIPDGGLRAWLQVLSGFMLYLNSWVNDDSNPCERRTFANLASSRALSQHTESFSRTTAPHSCVRKAIRVYHGSGLYKDFCWHS